MLQGRLKQVFSCTSGRLIEKKAKQSKNGVLRSQSRVACVQKKHKNKEETDDLVSPTAAQKENTKRKRKRKTEIEAETKERLNTHKKEKKNERNK